MKIYTYILSLLLIGSAFAADLATASSAKSPVASASTKTVKSLTATGSVLSLDMVGNTITVEGKKKVLWTFSVPATAKILEGKKAIVFGDIAAGFKIAVKYTKDGDTLTASMIRVWPVKKSLVNPKGK